jgi:hypothetical protein
MCENVNLSRSAAEFSFTELMFNLGEFNFVGETYDASSSWNIQDNQQ